MIAKEEIRKLPMQEKLALLEAVWAEISPEPDELEIPQWHKDLLDDRELALREGRTEVLDWEDAKRQIRAATR
jgi:putative addiction module component (TIGR02574 family)